MAAGTGIAMAPISKEPRIMKTTTEQFGGFIREVLYYSDGMRLNIDRRKTENE
ncbi:MAG: hypothetical protein ABSE82_15375 [Nitrososphaerales archaeon]|jgi:hypothetical protein